MFELRRHSWYEIDIATYLSIIKKVQFIVLILVMNQVSFCLYQRELSLHRGDLTLSFRIELIGGGGGGLRGV